MTLETKLGFLPKKSVYLREPKGLGVSFFFFSKKRVTSSPSLSLLRQEGKQGVFSPCFARKGSKARGFQSLLRQEGKEQQPSFVLSSKKEARDWTQERGSIPKPKEDSVSITYEEIGLFPRSFSRVLDRFLKQIFSDVENLVIQEYRFYRYLFLTTLKCLVILFFVPFIVNFFSKNFLLHPLIQYIWNNQQNEIFLNSYQQKRAFAELKEFEEKLYFESLIAPSLKNPYKFQNFDASKNGVLIGGLFSPFPSEERTGKEGKENEELLGRGDCQPQNIHSSSEKKEFGSSNLENQTVDLNPQVGKIKLPQNKVFNSCPANLLFSEKIRTINSVPSEARTDSIFEEKVILESKDQIENFQKAKKENSKKEFLEQRLQEKTIDLAEHYNNLSIDAITNFFADLLSFITLCYLLFALEIQLNITKSFLLEVFFGLDDSKKSLLILLITDLLVGYHSSNLWELFFEFLFNHYGLPESQTGIFLLVATLPVLLDVLFKYLIFRHLNRSSPATVATYHAMIE